MAALRNLRNSSRLSSPFTQQGKDNNNANNSNVNVTYSRESVKAEPTPSQGAGSDFGHSVSDPWEEPPTRAPAASFEDVPGLDRQGVLEHMAPLGSVPTSKFLAKLRLAPSRAHNRFSSPAPTAPFPNPQEDDSTAAPTNGYNSVDTHSPINLSPRSDSFRPEEIMTTRSSATRGRAVAPDEDYRPPSSAVPAMTASPKPKKSSKSSTPVMPSASSIKSLNTGSVSSPPPSIQNVKTRYSLEIMKTNASLAIQLAEAAGQFGNARGLRNFLNDSQKDPIVLLAMDAIFQRSADRTQIRLLRKYMKAGAAAEGEKPNRRGRRSGASPIIPPIQSLSPQAGLISQTPPSSSSIPLGAPQVHQTSSPPQEGAQRTTPSRNNSTKSSESSTVVVGAAQPMSTGRDPSPVDSGAAGDEEVVRIDGQERLEVPRMRHRRSRSASESSLSSAQSLENPLVDAQRADATEGSRTGAKAGPATGRRQAPNRQVSVPASSLPSLPPHHRQPISPVTKPPFYASWPIVNKPPNSRRYGNKRSIALTPEEEAEFQEQRKRLSEETFEHRQYREGENTEELRQKFSETIDERTHLNIDPASVRPSAPEAPIRAPVIHHLSVYANENSESNSSPVEATFSPTIAPSPTFPNFPNLRNGTGKKRTRNDIEEEEEAGTPNSSGPGDHLAPPIAGQGSPRAGTPRIMGRPAKKIKKSARIMVSPQKNKAGGVTAGTARSRGDHSTANGADSDEEKNNDFCSACGGNGKLLCCDGCPNSFHFTCLDPPMNPKQPPEGEWLCARCRAQHHRHEPQGRGFFGRLLGHVDDTNPKAFALSSYLRNYFEGVRTGEEGEYEDYVVNRQIHEPFRTNRMGAPEEPDYKKLRDKDGSLVTCYACGRSTENGRREIIPCDFCSARFHIDCLDPPLAVPPRRRPGDKPNATFRCPLHTDILVQNICQDRSPEYIATLANGEKLIPRKPKLRRPKNAQPVDIGAERGTKNNGLVDIGLMPEASDEFRDIDMAGEVYRIPEKGLRLDFIDKVKRSYAEDRVLSEEAKRVRKLRSNLYRPTNKQVQPVNLQKAQTARMNEIASHHALRKAQIEANGRTQKALQNRSMREQRAIMALKDLSEGFESLAADNVTTSSGGIKRKAAETGIDDTDSPPKAAKQSIDQLWNGLVGEMPDEVLDLFEKEELSALEAAMRIMGERMKVLNDRTERKGGTAVGSASAGGNVAEGERDQARVEGSTATQDVFLDATARTEDRGAEFVVATDGAVDDAEKDAAVLDAVTATGADDATATTPAANGDIEMGDGP